MYQKIVGDSDNDNRKSENVRWIAPKTLVRRYVAVTVLSRRELIELTIKWIMRCGSTGPRFYNAIL